MEGWAVPKANDAITISLVPPRGFPSSSSTVQTFHPAMTYQIFEGESIYGYKDLAVDIKFRSDDMSPSIAVKYDEKLEAAGTTANEVKVDDVEPALREYLPADTPSELDLSESNFAPPGEHVNTYFTETSKFHIYRANLSDKIAQDIVRRTQILAVLFIEAGSVIDLSEEGNALCWDVFFIYEILPNDKVSFAGFCTVHKYWYFLPEKTATIKANDANGETDEFEKGTKFRQAIMDNAFTRLYRARISQFVILPPYQRQGHAKELYNTIITTYLADPLAKEIPVEDPSERFEDIRDIADYTRLKKAGLVTPAVVEMLLERGKKVRLWIDTQRQVAKMDRRQFMRIVEMLMLEAILDDTENDLEEQRDRLRIYVKERLYRQNKDILMQLERDDRKVKLHETYENVEDDYVRLLRKLDSKALNKLMELASASRSVISGKRAQSEISTIEEDEEGEEEEEELEPPSKRKRTKMDM
ncbi:Histone acetyltransferase [Drechslerella dactyloides]|uniref:Histone acetyltransferase type B catalytic subunit n=1 Tax=Drechslerella dactyloides TaxID=74499 RepID=A0AAD6J6Q2_DREDA|nr:Histone acetyltransferase [Drechslerella dactyloides]